MKKAFVAVMLALSTTAHAAETSLGDLLKNLFRSAQAASAPLSTGHPDAAIASGSYVLKDKQSNFTVQIKDIGTGRALVAYHGEQSEENAAGDAFSASLRWAIATAGGAAWTVAHAENDPALDCRLQFVAHARSINIQAHDCSVAGTFTLPRNAILKWAGPLQGDEFADAEKQLGLPATLAASSPGTSSTLVGRTFKGPNAVLEQFRNTQTLDFGGDGLARRVVHLGELGGSKHVLVLMRRSSDWIVAADLTIATATAGLSFVGSNDTSEYAPSMHCAVDGRKVDAFGFMRPSGTTFVSSNHALVWVLDPTGHPLPVKGGRVICR